MCLVPGVRPRSFIRFSKDLWTLYSLQTNALRGKYNDLYLHFGPMWPSLSHLPHPSCLLKIKYSEKKSRIRIPAMLGFLGFSPPAAESVASSSADQAWLSLLRQHLFNCVLKVVESSYSFHSNPQDGFWSKLLDTVDSPESVPNWNVLFSYWIVLW